MTIRTLALTALFLAPLTAAAEDEGPCKVATKGDSPIAQACQKGGRAAAEDTMKSMVKAAKAKGVAFKCVACHEDMDSFKLKSNAGDDFKKLLAAQK
jgi:hypothetical protein